MAKRNLLFLLAILVALLAAAAFTGFKPIPQDPVLGIGLIAAFVICFAWGLVTNTNTETDKRRQMMVERRKLIPKKKNPETTQK